MYSLVYYKNEDNQTNENSSLNKAVTYLKMKFSLITKIFTQVVLCSFVSYNIHDA